MAHLLGEAIVRRARSFARSFAAVIVGQARVEG